MEVVYDHERRGKLWAELRWEMEENMVRKRMLMDGEEEK